MIQHFSFTFFPFFAFATKLFSTPVTSSNLRNQAPPLTGHSQKYFPEIYPSIWTKVTQADSCLAQGFSNFFSLHPHFQKMCCYATPLICSLDQLCRPTAQSRVLCGPVMFSLLWKYPTYWQPAVILIILNLTFWCRWSSVPLYHVD